MEIRTATGARFAAMLDLVDAAIRPEGAQTRARDDFPVILAPENGNWQFVATTEDEGSSASAEIVGCLACLIRPFVTSGGVIPVAGIGSVVTAAGWRGQGISSRLQRYALERIAAAKVPLAVLWTDRPEYYASRGFAAAGVEYHVDLTGCDLSDVRSAAGEIRSYRSRDLAQISALYDQHRWRTVRATGDARLLYGMRGTQGLVCGDDRRLSGYLFAGKGADFSDYVTEFGGSDQAVLALLAEAQRRRIASKLLVPQGAESLQRLLVARGADAATQTSGYWTVVDGAVLRSVVTGASGSGERWPNTDDPAVWLGCIDADGTTRPGALELAVWGFDSV